MKKLFVLLPTIGLLFLVSTSSASAGCNDYDGDSKGCNGACSPEKANGLSYECKYLSATAHCVESTSICGGVAPTPATACTESQIVDTYGQTTWNSRCTNIGAKVCQIGGNGQQTGYQCTCTNMSLGSCSFAANNCSTWNPTTCNPGPGVTPAPGVCCSTTGCVSPNFPAVWVNHYRSNNKDDSVVNDIVVAEGVASASFNQNCGAEQIDCTNGENISRRYPYNCGTPPPSTPPPSTPPPATPIYAGQCQDIKLYAPDWSPMTVTAFSKLSPGAAVYMCVKGTTLGVTAQILGSLVNAAYVGQSNPGDWMGIYKPGAYDNAPTIWKWLNNTNTSTPPTTVPSEIVVQFGTVPEGNWEVRYIKAGTSTATAKTPGYALTAPSNHYGPYDMARFTINGVLRPEVRMKREFNNLLTVNDYCDYYKIPTGMNKFAVQGEIHHLISGWK